MGNTFVRVGIIGMGIGRQNGKAIASNPRGRVVGLCDIVEERMHDFQKDLLEPTRKYTDYRELLRAKEIDAVFVGTPNQLHIPMAIDAIKAGKHVLCTKPLGHDLKLAKKLVEAAESSGLVNMMSLSCRFSAESKHLESLARKRVFGDLYYAKARSIRRSGIPAWNLGFIQKGGGAFRDMGVHCLDAAWALLGFPKPLSVLGVAGARFGPRGQGYWEFKAPPRRTWKQFAADDYAGGFIRFENNIGMQVESFWASHQPEEFQIEIFGSEAGAKMYPLTIYRTENGSAVDSTVKIQQKPDSAWDNVAGHFIDCILDGTKCQAPLRHGYRVQQMMEALLESGKTGKEVRLG
ncbi:MAG: Gfo/Idh/MocA family oxidoreductase [Planctomycetota bacterium]|nr:Gfo/Idh/MocA family oxidoreductase [Planctomycetota bacterium]